MNVLYLPGFEIETTAKILKQKFQRFLKEKQAGITVDQWVIIKILFSENNISQQILGQISHKDAPTITRIIDLLSKKGLVERLKSEEDRRKFQIHLNKAGKNKYLQIISIYDEFREVAYANVSEDESDSLHLILKKIQKNLF